MAVLLTTKTFWVGLATIGFGAYLLATGEVDHGIRTITEGLAMITIRDAIRTVGA